MTLESPRSARVPQNDSLLDQARIKLHSPATAAESPLPALAAAAFLALSAIGFVAVSILAPATYVAPAVKKELH